jgi:hypothetical protein
MHQDEILIYTSFTLLCLLIIVGLWRVYTKAGQPGWAIFVPVLNVFILTQIAGRPGWWTFLFFIPGANLALYLVISIDLAERFGKGKMFGVGVCLLPFVFLPILAFGTSEFESCAA